MAITASIPADRGPSPAAMDAAHRMRAVMLLDVDEFDMADAARALDITNEQLADAWPVLTSTERAAWKQLLKLERSNGN